MVGLLEPRVRDDEAALVEHEVRHEPVHERLGRGPELRRLAPELVERLGEPVRDLDVAPAQRADELVLVVARHAERLARRDHAHDEPQHARGVRAAVDEVADEHRGPPRRRGRADGPALVVPAQPVPQRRQQRLELAAAAVDVADDVERAGELAVVVEHPGEPHVRRRDLVGAPEHVDDPEALALQPREAAAQRGRVPLDDVRAEVAVRAGLVAAHALRDRHVEDDGDRQDVVLARQLHQARARVLLDVRRVDDREQPAPQPDADDVVQCLEGVRRRGLVVLVVRDDAAVVVARQHLRRGEAAGRERRLPGAGRADEDDERHLRDLEHLLHRLRRLLAHRANTPSCVGRPTSSSSWPTPVTVTAYPCRCATPSAQCRNSSRVHSNRWSRCRRCPGSSP